MTEIAVLLDWRIGSPRMSVRRNKLSAVALALFAIYLVQIIVKEAVEGHISTARSWRAAVALGLLALIASGGAGYLWRQATRKYRNPD